MAGGLALWWTAEVSITIVKESSNFIDTMLSIKGEDPWFGTFLYGPPHKEDKSKIRNESNPCWCIIGDFNIVSNQDEKEGGAPINLAQAGCFLSFMDESNMVDLPIKGGYWYLRSSNNLRSQSSSAAIGGTKKKGGRESSNSNPDGFLRKNAPQMSRRRGMEVGEHWTESVCEKTKYNKGQTQEVEQDKIREESSNNRRY
ncbi:hypothetical protein V6N11_061039 [Hibiscus sabdariffa]|uniref:DUF4283 domain-containing protein n=1 Tax=Hibiscus sabdariffa TaxID=183260 RepID=A0ABR2QS07_9ROSI